MIETIDSIERQIDIQADAQRVYDLVSRPGWWINSGSITDNLVSTDGDVSTVTHEKYGSFRIKAVEQRPPHYVSFRWLAGDQKDQAQTAVPSTLVEFWIEENAGGGVALRVLESGFSNLPISEEQRRKKVEENTKGWETELEVARNHVEGE